MALLKISEPGQSPDPHKHRLAVGIDLGTSNSLIATVVSGNPRILPQQNKQHLMPSVVRYSSESVMVGSEAKSYAVSDPQNTIVSVKRFMGRSLEDVQDTSAGSSYQWQQPSDAGVPSIVTDRKAVSAVEVSAEILKALINNAEDVLGVRPTCSVITVPAYFDDAQRQSTKDAAKIAGIKLLRLLNEPTAAAVAYGLDTGAEGVHVVYDLGGGTFDISVLRLSKGVFEVLATAGDTHLGGDDFDQAVSGWIQQQAGLTEPLSSTMTRRLSQLACDAKETLTDALQAVLELPLESGEVWSDELFREQFNQLIEPIVRRTRKPCRQALRDAGVELSDVREIVLVGGSTRVPQVREFVEKFFAKPPLCSTDPDEVVALGAALQADNLVGNRVGDDLLLLDVLPLSLGVETMGGLMEKTIHRSTPIPVAKAQEFTTYKDGQTAMKIHVYQGERELVADCRSLAEFVLSGIPPMVAGAARIRVTFEVDADGLLNVAAKELSSGVTNSIDVKPSFGLTDAEVETMLRDSNAHAADDIKSRALIEQKVDGQRVLEALEAALEVDGECIEQVLERQQIDQQMLKLQQVLENDDPDRIKIEMKNLEKVSEPFVTRRMNKSISSVMEGRTISDFEQ